MLRYVGWAGLLLLVVASVGCAKEQELAPEGPLPWYGRTRGGALVLSRDERLAVATNRSAGTVTVFKLDPALPLDEMVVGQKEIDLGAGSEPWAAVIGADDDTAYVITRHDQTLVRIADLRSAPQVDGELAVGSEPTSIVITPSGARLLVANFVDGLISVVTTHDFEQTGFVDLNRALVETGVLGEVERRDGLAHPRALALTDDGDDDDDDETLYATEFFSMPLPQAGTDVKTGYFDRNRQGFVYRVPLGERNVIDTIALAPVDTTGFSDSNGTVTGCFPNQLYAAAVEGDRLFVTSVCASPEGPTGKVMDNTANFKTVMHPVVFVVDTRTNTEVIAERRVLTTELESRYAADADADAAPRYPLIPNDIAFGPRSEQDGSYRGCVTALGADAVFCLGYHAGGGLIDIGSPGNRYIDLVPVGQPVGRLPVGIALSQTQPFALVLNDASQSFSILDLEAGRVSRTMDATELPRAREVRRSVENDGRQLFATGLNVWSFEGAARVSCEGCHPDGLSDGVTWFFPRGPRRTLSTAGTYFGNDQRRIMLWTGNIDEIHDIEGIARGIAGGVGAVLWQYPRDNATAADRIVYDGAPPAPAKPTTLLRQNLNAPISAVFGDAPSAEVCTEASTVCDWSPGDEWDAIDAFIKTVRAPRPPTRLDSAAVLRGSELFRQARCAGCHGGPGWTSSRLFYTPSVENNGMLPFERPSSLQAVEMLGRLRTTMYSVPSELLALNPPGASGFATFRRWDLLVAEPIPAAYEPKNNLDDQLNCVLRAVGTLATTNGGVVPVGSPTVVREVRHNMMDHALGDTGFNSPALVGLAGGGPYLHAGNARTLEELFDRVFIRHYQALSTGFLSEASPTRAEDLSDLVTFLLSIDARTEPVEIEPALDLCGQGDALFD